MVTIENEGLRVSFIISRGCEITEVRHKRSDVDVIAHAAKETPARQNYSPSTAVAKDTFFDFYAGGWQTSFPMGFTPGSYAGATHANHAEVSSLPWQFEVIEESPESVVVQFFCRCRRFPFSIRRTVTLTAECLWFSVEEVLTNESDLALEYAFGHHPALGEPFLAPHCIVDLPDGEYTTLTEVQANATGRRFKLGQKSREPILMGNSGERIGLTSLPSKSSRTMDNYGIKISGEGFWAVRNPRLGLGFGMKWNSAQMQHLWVWEVSHGCPHQPLWGKEYLMAFEPFNVPLGCGVIDLFGKGILPTLNGGESAPITFSAGFCAAERTFTGEFPPTNSFNRPQI